MNTTARAQPGVPTSVHLDIHIVPEEELLGSALGNSQDIGVSMRAREVAHICGERFGMRTLQ